MTENLKVGDFIKIRYLQEPCKFDGFINEEFGEESMVCYKPSYAPNRTDVCTIDEIEEIITKEKYPEYFL